MRAHLGWAHQVEREESRQDRQRPGHRQHREPGARAAARQQRPGERQGGHERDHTPDVATEPGRPVDDHGGTVEEPGGCKPPSSAKARRQQGAGDEARRPQHGESDVAGTREAPGHDRRVAEHRVELQGAAGNEIAGQQHDRGAGEPEQTVQRRPQPNAHEPDQRGIERHQRADVTRPPELSSGEQPGEVGRGREGGYRQRGDLKTPLRHGAPAAAEQHHRERVDHHLRDDEAGRYRRP